MPPGEIDPSRLPGVIPNTRKAWVVEDMSSDDDAVNAFCRDGAKQPKGRGATHQPAPKAKAARGEGALGAPKGNPPKAAGHVAAAPTAVPRGQPAKRPSPMRLPQRDHQLRVAPAPNVRRRSLSGEVSAAPAAASSSPALPVDDAYLHNMLRKRRGRGGTEPSVGDSDEVILVSPFDNVPRRQSPRRSGFSPPSAAQPSAPAAPEHEEQVVMTTDYV